MQLTSTALQLGNDHAAAAAALQAEKTELQTQNTQLGVECEALRVENQQLRVENQQQQKRIDDLEAEQQQTRQELEAQLDDQKQQHKEDVTRLIGIRDAVELSRKRAEERCAELQTDRAADAVEMLQMKAEKTQLTATVERLETDYAAVRRIMKCSQDNPNKRSRAGGDGDEQT
jgi:chromosome segregation ATPase